MTSAVTVRPATLDDLDDLTALEAEAFPLDPWSANLVGEGVDGRLPTVSWLVAEHADGFAGYAVVSVVDVDAELQRIAVPGDQRGRGIAADLMAAVLAHARAEGASRLLLEVREDNMAALALYARHGLIELGRRPRYYRDGTTALVLARDLPARMEP